MEKQKLWAGACGVLAVLLAGFLFFANGRLSALQDVKAKNQAAISDLKAELEDKKPDEPEAATPLTEEEQDAAMQSAAELGKKVADCQNAYASLSSAKDKDAFQKNVEAMDACLSEDAKGARVPWYSGGGRWEFVTDGTFKGESRNVLWLCKDAESGELLAYATAAYHVADQVFSDVSYQMSLLGTGRISSSGTPGGADVDADKVNDLAGDIADIPTNERELTDDENANVKDSQQRLREMMEKGEVGE